MRRVRPLVLALSIAVVTVMGLATSASAAISNLNAEYVQDPTTPTNITVNWSFDQTDFPFYGNSMQVFATTAGWPGCDGEWPFSTRWVNSALHAATFHNGLKDAHHEGSDTIEVPAGRSLCVGVAVYDDTVTVYDATHFYFDKPSVDDSFVGGHTTTTIGHEIKITPNGLPTKYHLEYFKPTTTTNCNTPDQADLDAKQETAEETISDDLYGEHTVYPEITGLEPQTSYCVRLNISNAQGEYFAYFWARDTAIPIPILANESYTGQDGYIGFEIDVTPGAISISTSLYFQYFEKVGSTCTLVPGEESTYNFHSLTPSSGTVMTHHFGSVPNLEAHKYYCVRAYATNPGGGTTPGPFHTVRTVIQSPVTLSYEYFQTPSDIDNYDINFAIGVDDSGAYEDLGEEASMELNQYRVPSSECNAEGVSAAEPIFSADEQFGAGSVSDFDYDLVAGPRGTDNCLSVDLANAWGPEFESTHFLPYRSGVKPTFSAPSTSHTGDSITLSATIDPGEQTTYVALYSEKLDENGDCSLIAPTTQILTPITTDLSDPHSLTATATGLDEHTSYCVLFIANNNLGGGATQWQNVKTDDITAPSKPNGLAVSNVTMSGGTVSWSPSTDNDSVDHYNVYKSGHLLATKSSPSIEIAALCGTTDHFKVGAVDPSGNESELTDEIALTTAACPVPPPAAKTCLSPTKAKSLVLKKGKKKIKASVKTKLSADKQSMTITASAKGAKIAFTVAGKKAKATKGSITVANNPALVTVTFTLAGKSKKVNLKLAIYLC